MKKNNKVQDAQQVLINNLKNQLNLKRDRYSEMIYCAAILKVANEKIPVINNNLILNKLPTL
jgi:hypothetical protein